MNLELKTRSSVSQEFLNEVSEKLNAINMLAKDTGVEIPNELEETLKELSVSSSHRTPFMRSSNSSIISEGPKESFIDIPEPSDQSVLNSSVESASMLQLKQNSHKICKAVRDKLQEFRSLNKKSRDQGVIATKELKNYRFELKDIKNSVVEIIDEANSTKEQIIKMKERLESELKEQDSMKYEEYDMSACKPGQDNFLVEQIKDLHQEIYKIQSRIEKSERELTQKEHENKELKRVIEKLNESFEKIGTETEGKSSMCEGCLII